MIPGQIHSRTATALAAVERALAELRRGGIVVLRDDDGAGGLVIAAEACGPHALQRLQGLAEEAGRHAALRYLSRPVASHAPRIAETAIELAKLARLLPAVVLGPLTRDANNKRRDWARDQDLVYVDAVDVLAYEENSSRNLQQVAQAHVPLEGAENARILAWRPSDGGKEHLAIVVGEIDPTEPVLIRLHSECFTGDLLGSLRCDCGVQLRGAIEQLNKQ